MADPVNNFGPLTPEQEAQLRKQIIVESASPLDALPLGAGAGAGALMYKLARSGEGIPRWIAALLGGGFGAGTADITQKGMERMRYGGDAERQQGGFYGDDGRAAIARRLLGQ